MNRTGQVFFYENFTGIIYENENGFFFQYDEYYLSQENVQAISLTLPLQKQAFQSSTLFRFFIQSKIEANEYKVYSRILFL